MRWSPRSDTLDLVDDRPDAGVVQRLSRRSHVHRRGLPQHLRTLTEHRVEGVIFVGVPRTMADGETGVTPTDALASSVDIVAHQGILIPAREGEHGRLTTGPRRRTFGRVTSSLDAIIGSCRLRPARPTTGRRSAVDRSSPLSSGASVSSTGSSGSGHSAVAAEQAFVADLAASSATDQRRLGDLYTRSSTASPTSASRSASTSRRLQVLGPAFETFAELLGARRPADEVEEAAMTTIDRRRSSRCRPARLAWPPSPAVRACSRTPQRDRSTLSFDRSSRPRHRRRRRPTRPASRVRLQDADAVGDPMTDEVLTPGLQDGMAAFRGHAGQSTSSATTSNGAALDRRPWPRPTTAEPLGGTTTLQVTGRDRHLDGQLGQPRRARSSIARAGRRRGARG